MKAAPGLGFTSLFPGSLSGRAATSVHSWARGLPSGRCCHAEQLWRGSVCAHTVQLLLPRPTSPGAALLETSLPSTPPPGFCLPPLSACLSALTYPWRVSWVPPWWRPPWLGCAVSRVAPRLLHAVYWCPCTRYQAPLSGHCGPESGPLFEQDSELGAVDGAQGLRAQWGSAAPLGVSSLQ